jgi:hypothetical protein
VRIAAKNYVREEKSSRTQRFHWLTTVCRFDMNHIANTHITVLEIDKEIKLVKTIELAFPLRYTIDNNNDDS